MSSPTSTTMNITNLHNISLMNEMREMDSHNTATNLETVLKQSLQNINDKSNNMKNGIENQLDNPLDLTRPENLLAFQTNISDYNIYISLVSTVARKAVSSVETLVKGQ